MTTPPAPADQQVLVVRSEVPQDLEYQKYLHYLRFDFFYSCGYCTISEHEAQAIGFSIDHYEPQNKAEHLKHSYQNLIYSCVPCNTYKSDRWPSESARQDGLRFFRPDHDVHSNHFQRQGPRLQGKTPTGEFSIDALELNRLTLRRLRELRERLTSCDALVAEGVMGLRRFQLDLLPNEVKGRALTVIRRMEEAGEAIVKGIDAALRAYAASEITAEGPSPEQVKAAAQERKERLKNWETLYPGEWRAPRKTSKGKGI